MTQAFRCKHKRVLPAALAAEGLMRIQDRARYFGLVTDCCGLHFSCWYIRAADADETTSGEAKWTLAAVCAAPFTAQTRTSE